MSHEFLGYFERKIMESRDIAKNKCKSPNRLNFLGILQENFQSRQVSRQASHQTNLITSQDNKKRQSHDGTIVFIYLFINKIKQEY